MKKSIFILVLSVLSVSLIAQNEPQIKKLPVKISILKVEINNKTGERTEVINEGEFMFKYNKDKMLVNSVFKYGDKKTSEVLEYDQTGNLSMCKYMQGDDEKEYLHLKFEYNKYNGFDYVKMTDFEEKRNKTEENYFYDPVTLLPKGIKDIKSPLFEYDDNNNLIKMIYIMLGYKKTEIREYGTVYSPYICVRKLPMWFVSTKSLCLLIPPELFITGKYCPVSYIEKVQESQRNYQKNSKVYEITKDENNYPVMIRIINERDPSVDYSLIKEFHIKYQIVE